MANKKDKQEHAYKKFGADLKSDDFGPVLFLYGIEQYLVEWAALSLVKKYVNPAALSFDFVKRTMRIRRWMRSLHHARLFQCFQRSGLYG